MAMSEAKRLTRSRNDRMLAGVCGGMARYLGMDPTLFRILYVMVSIMSVAFPGMLFYLICWVIIPEESRY